MRQELSCVGVVAHPKRPQTLPVAEAIAESLRRHGLMTWIHSAMDDDTVIEAVRCADMIIAIGGDGAMLRAGRLSAPFRLPVVGVNMGRLGFLTEIESPDDWEPALGRLLRGDYWIEKRMMITASVERTGEIIFKADALNDVVISGTAFGRMIQLETYIDNDWTTTYNADALILATPTGSTAYALSSGGPILPPDLSNLLLVPVAPHLSLDRPIVLSEGSRVDIRQATGNRHEVMLTVDGLAVAQLETTDIVQVRASEHSSRFVRMRERSYFYRSLLDRLEPRVNRPEHQPEKLRPE